MSINKATVSGLKLGDSEKIFLGQNIYALGSPAGVLNTLSSGLISSIRNQMIQITAPISPGSSGGALIDEYGQVIGITSLGVLEEEDLGYAIPINLFKRMDKDVKLNLSEFRGAINSMQMEGEEEAYYKNLGMARRDGQEFIYTDKFSTDTSVIYATGMFYSSSEYTTIKSEWHYIDNGELINLSELETEETNAEFYFSVRVPNDGWPKGSYEVSLFINDEYQDTLEFRVE